MESNNFRWSGRKTFVRSKRRLNWFSLSNQWVHWIAIDTVFSSFLCLITSWRAINDNAELDEKRKVSSTAFRWRFFCKVNWAPLTLFSLAAHFSVRAERVYSIKLLQRLEEKSSATFICFGEHHKVQCLSKYSWLDFACILSALPQLISYHTLSKGGVRICVCEETEEKIAEISGSGACRHRANRDGATGSCTSCMRLTVKVFAQ